MVHLRDVSDSQLRGRPPGLQTRFQRQMEGIPRRAALGIDEEQVNAALEKQTAVGREINRPRRQGAPLWQAPGLMSEKSD
jgi:hypothetical protein